MIYKGNDNYWLEATSDDTAAVCRLPGADAGLVGRGPTLGTAALTTNTWTF